MFIELIEAIADLSASGLLVIGANRAKLPANKAFPFGHGREVYFWSFISAILIIGIASTFSIYFGWQRLTNPHEIKNIQLTFLILLITTCTNGYAFYISLKRLRGKIHSRSILNSFLRSSLVEIKTTFVLDLMGTVASILGFFALLIYVATGDLRFDGIGGITVGFTLATLGILLILGIRDLLVGKSASNETLELLKKIALTIPEVNDVLEVKTMHIGSERLLVNMNVTMKNNLTTQEVAKTIDEIERRIRIEMPAVKHIQVELDLPE